MKSRVKLSLDELEAVNGGGFFDYLANAAESTIDTISDVTNEVIDILDDLF